MSPFEFWELRSRVGYLYFGFKPLPSPFVWDIFLNIMEFVLVFIIVSFYDHFSREKNQGNDELKTNKRPFQCRLTS